MTKTSYIQIRVNDQDKALWLAKATTEGRSLSEWIRRRLDASPMGLVAYPAPPPPPLPAYLAHVRMPDADICESRNPETPAQLAERMRREEEKEMLEEAANEEKMKGNNKI